MALVRLTARTGAVRRNGGCALTLALVVALGATALAQGGPTMPDGPEAQEARASGQTTAGPKATTGEISGTVIDGDGDMVPGAQLSLVVGGMAGVRQTTSDDNGGFRFSGVAAGKFTVTAKYPGMTSGTFIGVLHAGEALQTLPIKLDASASESVQVVATQEELAAAEVKVEETQRVAGILPNFFVSYDWHAAPLTSKLKFELSFRSFIDPVTFGITGITAGVQQAKNSFPGYGRGAAGYGKRFAADSGDVLTGTFLGGYVFPVLLHQDPRYFYKGTGTIWSRTRYALAASVMCRGDNGRRQPNYSSVLGDLAAGGLSNLYYPASDRDGIGLTFENGLLAIGEDAIGNVVQELIFRHLTPHAPTYASTSNQPPVAAGPASPSRSSLAPASPVPAGTTQP